MNYTSEENTLILLSLLKQHNIKKIVASPGATNISFVASVQNDDFFEVYSCVDERSAAYLACGLSEESNEPVVLSCTGATASRNYFPGLTEAYYRKLPIIAITSTQHTGKIGQGVAQVIDRSVQPKDIVKLSVQLPSVYSDDDKWACNLNINKALLEVKHNGGGPVHINLVTNYSNDFSVTELPQQRVIKRIENQLDIPNIQYNSCAIFIGAHSKMSQELMTEIEQFCENYNAVVLVDRTSNYFGKYKIMANIIGSQEEYYSKLRNIELLIDIGNISGAYLGINPKEVWRVNPDGEIRDTFRKLKYIFEMEEIEFFKKYNNIGKFKGTEYYTQWKNERDKISSKIIDSNIPFSNIWVAKNTIDLLPDEATLHVAILNTLRAWNYFDTNKILYGYCNTGGFGIDGIVSTLIGASYANKEKRIFGIVGDLAFFYDMNSLGIRDIKDNIRLIIINNGGGTEFHNYNHRASIVGKNYNREVGKYVAADGHYGNQSNELVKNYVENLGFKYVSARNKEEYLENINEFIDGDINQSIIFEIFTTPENESKALKIMNNLEKDRKITIKRMAKNTLKKVVGKNNIKKIKKFLKK